MPKRRVLRASSDVHLNALASPVRQELLQRAMRLGWASARELAEAMRREPATIYYHLRILERAGLLEAQAGDDEQLYRVPATRIDVRPDGTGARTRRLRRKIVGTMVRFAQALHDRALDRTETRTGGSARELVSAQRFVELDRAGLEHLNRGIAQLLREAGEVQCDGGERYVLTLLLAPQTDEQE